MRNTVGEKKNNRVKMIPIILVAAVAVAVSVSCQLVLIVPILGNASTR